MAEQNDAIHPFKAKIISFIGKAPEEVTDEEILEKAQEKFDELESIINKVEEAKKEFELLVKSDPVWGAIIDDVSKGATFQEALARHITPEDLVPPEGDPDYEVWEKAKKERIEKLKNLESNREKFIKNVEEFVAENNLSEEETNALLGAIDELINKALNYSVTKDDLKKFYAVINGLDEVKDKAKKLDEIKEQIGDKIGDGVPNSSAAPSAQTEVKKVDLYQWIKNRNL